MTDKIIDLLEQKKYTELRRQMEYMNEVDIAQTFDFLDIENTLKLFRLLPKEMAAEVFAYMDNESRQQIIEAITDNELKFVVDELYIDDTVDLIEEMPANVVKRVILAAKPQDRQAINQILNYPDDSAGSIMTTEFVDLKKEMSVAQAFNHIRRTGPDKETIYTCYVTDQNRFLDGVVTVKELLLARPEDKIVDIMESNVIFAHTLDDQEQIANMFRKYDMIALPVVDKENRLVGIITIDDAVDVIQEENTEDFEKMAAMTPTDAPYLKTSPFVHAKKRVIWLLLLMLSAAITGSIITTYQDSFASMPILVAFIPMLMGTGGNCGSQSSTLIIRGMALDEIRLKDFFKVWFKEVRVALLVATILVIVNSVRIYIQYQNFGLVLSVGISLFVIVILAKSLGCILPMAAKKLKLDPAIMASSLITTVTDACSVFLYFNVANFIMNLGV